MPRAFELAPASSTLSSSASTNSSTLGRCACATSLVTGLLPFKAQCKSAVALVNERRIDFVRAKNVRVIGRLAGILSENRPQKDEKRELTSGESVEKVLAWQHSRKIGPGFANLGNTCYLNSVLQCLTYTPCFAQLLLNKELFASFITPTGTSLSTVQTFGNYGARGTHGNGFCSVRAMAKLLQSVHGNNTLRVLQPKELVMNVRHISKGFRIGRQEDSHEFFRLLLDAMQRSCLRRAHVKSESHTVATTTFVHRIFGGKLKNCLQCAKCGFVSERFDDFLDLSLEIATGVHTVMDALRHFTATEKLDDRNAWKCSQCGNFSRAEKGLSIAKCPNVLTIQLKRFDVLSGKIKRHIEFPQLLDIAFGMSKDCDDLHQKRTKYELHAVLVHAGYSTDCGHYFAYVKGSSGQWYEMNDDSVRWVGPDTVLQQKAYMLFYSRVLPPMARLKATEQGIGKEKALEIVDVVHRKKDKVVVPTTVVRTVQELDMAGFLARVRTPVATSIDATDGVMVTTNGTCHTQLNTVVTFQVTQVATDVPLVANRQHHRFSPSFSGRLGRVYRFHPTSWARSGRLGMKRTIATLSDHQEVPIRAIASNAAPCHVPFDPRQLQHIGKRSAALFGRAVDKWTGETDVESSETTSDEAVDKAVVGHHDRVLNALKQEDWTHRNSRRLDYWDETLDTGNVKKEKKRKHFVANQGRHNVFQTTLMRQKESMKRHRTECR